MASDLVPSAESLGYPDVRVSIPIGESGGIAMMEDFANHRINSYDKDLDYPAVNGVSKLSSRLSAGTVSIRPCVVAAITQGALRGCGGAEHWLSELIWREFYKMVMFHFPHTAKSPFQQRYTHLKWSNPERLINAWTQARTGYPIVDAAIRQIHTTGLMHNRLRMIASMFLTKDLDTDWRIGERYFMQWLMDYDQASNVGGWQWSAGTGTDAAPYFRIMNPILQGHRYDPDGLFVKSMLPELSRVPPRFAHEPWMMPSALQRQCGCVIGQNYPSPIVDHNTARKAAIKKLQD
jgi:deoxyribodipyrimidine photo-lyase